MKQTKPLRPRRFRLTPNIRLEAWDTKKKPHMFIQVKGKLGWATIGCLFLDASLVDKIPQK